MAFESFRDALREGAADVFGFREDQAALRDLSDRFMEVRADARMIARKAEEANWLPLTGGSTAYFEPTREARKEVIKRAHNYYFNDPIVGRTIDLRTLYTFGKGLPKPKYRENVDRDNEDEKIGQRYIDRFWWDRDNQACLTSYFAQISKSTELQLQGEIFFLLFRSDERADEAVVEEEETEWNARPSPLKITDLPESEITEIISHPGNRKIPVYYKRVYKPQVYNFEKGAYEEGTEEVAIYYRHWRNEAPSEWNGRPWGPREEQIGEGLIYHLALNKTSDMKRGVPEVQRYLKWAQGLNEYMTSRMATVQAIAQIALQAKTKGGPKNVTQVAGVLSDISRMANTLESATNLERTRTDQGRTKAAVSSQGVELQPMVQDTGSAGAQIDVQVFKGQIAAGAGVPVHHLGDVGTANMATATSMDAPLQRLIEAMQEMFETVYRDLLGFMMEGLGLDPGRVEVTMPPILQRDVAGTNAALAGMLTTVDPNLGNKDLIKFYVEQVLDAMGFVNATELVDRFFPDEWVTPEEKAQAQMEQEQQANAAGEEGAALLADEANNQEIDDTLHQRLWAQRDGPENAGGVTRDRAETRRQRNISREGAFVEGDAGAALRKVDGNGFSPELADVAEAAIGLLDQDDELVEPADGQSD